MLGSIAAACLAFAGSGGGTVFHPQRPVTPLMVVAYGGTEEATLWLLRHGANPNLKDSEGRDCFALAKLSNTSIRIGSSGR
ncbi:MAG TPA: hypothetical protein VMI31_17110 [Fimbriimonadaceae bacterium]|nr:hypothetical protein [Fimbriimonadaceae bacterium]